MRSTDISTESLAALDTNNANEEITSSNVTDENTSTTRYTHKQRDHIFINDKNIFEQLQNHSHETIRDWNYEVFSD